MGNPSGSLNGHAWRQVIAKTAAYTLDENDNGCIFTNAGATGAFAFSLPAALKGMRFDFHVMAAYELRIDPNGSETIGLPSTGVQGAAGKYLGADAVGEWVSIVCLADGAWTVQGYFGTWTAES